MQNAIPAGLFDGDPDTVIERINALLTDRNQTRDQTLVLIGLKLGFIAGLKRTT